MAANFLLCGRDGELLLPPSLREWLPQDHLAWFVLDAVEEMDLSAFYGAYREDGWGRAAFEPQMMVALLLYSYAVAERSSRGIERRCREDVAFRVITANQVPDHATIARFRARHEQALADTLVHVLALCAKAGLVSVGAVALDGSLLAGNASPQRRAATRRSVRRSSGSSSMRARGGSALRRCKQQLEQEQADEQAAQDENLAWRAQKRLWRHDQTASTLLRQDSRQRGKKGAISRPQQGSSLLPSEPNELMSQDEQFDVFGELAAAAADHHPQHSREGEIGERKEHAPMLPSPATKRSKSESVARPSAAELRSPQRSGIRARA